MTKARNEFQHYFVDAQNLLIAYIAVDQTLLDTQTRKEIATQQQAQYQEEARAEAERISVQEQRARADQQSEVVAAKLSVEIAADRAEALRREAEGVSDSTGTKAMGEAEAVRKVGLATAEAYLAQSEVIGAERLAVLKVLEEISTGQVKITPEVMVSSGGNDNAGGGLFNAWLATALAPGAKESKIDKMAPDGSVPVVQDVELPSSEVQDEPDLDDDDQDLDADTPEEDWS